jgi:hypothetical protein
LNKPTLLNYSRADFNIMNPSQKLKPQGLGPDGKLAKTVPKA